MFYWGYVQFLLHIPAIFFFLERNRLLANIFSSIKLINFVNLEKIPWPFNNPLPCFPLNYTYGFDSFTQMTRQCAAHRSRWYGMHVFTCAPTDAVLWAHVPCAHVEHANCLILTNIYVWNRFVAKRSRQTINWTERNGTQHGCASRNH